MKKIYIKVVGKNMSRLVCANDISKMYYFKMRPIPRPPKYSDSDEDFDKNSEDPCLTE